MNGSTSTAATRVFAVSDVHADHRENMTWLRALSAADYRDAALILAGDVSDDLAALDVALTCVRRKFAEVFFVPGNHELWIRRRECADSLAKFRRVLQLCDDVGVRTRPATVGRGATAVWIIPLLSWYVRPEEGPDSLFVAKDGEDPTLAMWSDKYFTAWPPLNGSPTVAQHFLALNEPHLAATYDAPVISFSHFLPRRDLIFSTPAERRDVGVPLRDPHPTFNFSRVAGCAGLETQIRRLGSLVHVYGHQHRNRDRVIDGVRYVSHCLGYPRERRDWYARGAAGGPTPIEVPATAGPAGGGLLNTTHM